MIEEAPIRAWLGIYGYVWKPGREELDKAIYTAYEAKTRINDLLREGAIEYVGHAKPKAY